MSKVRISSVIDVDFPSTTMKKVHFIKNTKHLLAALNNDDGEISISQNELNAFDYHIVGTDLRNANQLGAKLVSCGLKFDLPTIFVSECVLVYMETKASAELLKWVSDNFRTSVFLHYEQVNMTDRFAQVMLNNLTLRGCRLAGVEYCKDLTTQKNRFIEAGWAGVKGWTMNEVYASISPKEIERVEAIEMLDEHELLKQLFDHYCIVVAYNDAMSISLENIDLQL
jgi:[phosphatase 2A protein]-leucine-carboxy methyltransferase